MRGGDGKSVPAMPESVTTASGNRGKYGITLYDSQYQYNNYAAIRPIMMGVSDKYNFEM
jgi:hypothetical protein